MTGANSKEQILRDYAKKQVLNVFQSSQVEDRINSFPKFDRSELSLGKLLGQGAFGAVYEVRAFHVKQDKDEEARKFLSQNCLRETTGQSRYAVKVLRTDIIKEAKDTKFQRYLQATMDAAIETRMLSDIEHPNIIKLRATCSQDVFSTSDYFIVMDRLYDTLEIRIKQWSARDKRLSGLAGKVSDRKGLKRAALYEERIVAAFDLAAALDYLHVRNIVYRDLKPENIGFDVRNDIKIFDFGLAKELKPGMRNNDGTYNLTEMTGSMRYMAGEVANALPYNETCDCYSFAVLLWEMLALQTPYEMYTMKSLREKVYNLPYRRPPIDVKWSTAVKEVLSKGWDSNLQNRMSMAQITKVLKRECVRVRDGDTTGLEHCRRRSTFVFRARKSSKKLAS